jgi:hypothetical protein
MMYLATRISEVNSPRDGEKGFRRLGDTNSTNLKLIKIKYTKKTVSEYSYRHKMREK